MASVNKAIVLGNIGRDPEVRYSASGSAVCNLSIATTRKWKSKDGEAQEETEWHRGVFYDRLAEVADEYLGKGSAVYVEGRLKTRKWQDKDGIDRYTTEIVGEHTPPAMADWLVAVARKAHNAKLTGLQRVAHWSDDEQGN